ncbi:hypothetical protein PV10_06242 [Exophiala mesophila]|uniref:Uncharacterized protein n=1 Tax=Exophiala mesophila TaxID=212818 RepID=A0A0D1ZXY5_EXOME|nr:uncharacterized protein PV10_06242 [Exophiala mesophila]KIV91733.1 hypothetical protein PV10_06242 [Exophiala mesophila]
MDPDAATSDQHSWSNSGSPLTFPDSPSGQPREDPDPKPPLTLQNLHANQWVHLTRHFGYIEQAKMIKEYPQIVLFETKHNGAESCGVFDVAKGYLPSIRFNIAISPGAKPGSCPVITQSLFDRISTFPTIYKLLDEDADTDPAGMVPSATTIVTQPDPQHIQVPYTDVRITTKVRLDFALPIRILDPHKKVWPGRSPAMTISCRFICFVTPDALDNYNDTNYQPATALPVVDMWLPANENYLTKVDDAPGWLITPSFANFEGLVETPGESFLKLTSFDDVAENVNASGS